MPKRIQSLIELLCDGNCHSLFELETGAKLSEYQTKEVVGFLTEFGIIELADGKEKAKISNAAKELFSETKP